MSKRSKKFNPMKAAISASNILAKRYMFAMVGKSEPIILKRDGRRPKSVSNALLAALLDVPQCWSVYLAALLRDNQGRDYVQSIEINLKNRMTQAGLTTDINDMHHQLISETNPRHFVNVGWIASPARLDIDDEQASEIMTKLGGWQTLAKWEADKIGLDKCEVLSL